MHSNDNVFIQAYYVPFFMAGIKVVWIAYTIEWICGYSLLNCNAKLVGKLYVTSSAALWWAPMVQTVFFVVVFQTLSPEWHQNITQSPNTDLKNFSQRKHSGVQVSYCNARVRAKKDNSRELPVRDLNWNTVNLLVPLILVNSGKSDPPSQHPTHNTFPEFTV